MRTIRQLCALFLFVWSMALVFPASAQEPDSGQSLADVARKLRKDTSEEVKMTDADAKRLFKSVDTIFDFAAEDSGMEKHAVVKRRMVSKSDVEKYVQGNLAKEEYAQRFVQEEMSMKKLGFIPRDFNLKEFLTKSSAQGIAGYYDPESKTISLLTWVPADRQEPILAHELTHALQDQNYDLTNWMKSAEKAKSGAEDESAVARKAVVEGQAMVVYVDYILKPVGRTLQNTPDLLYSMEDPAVKGMIDSQLAHDSPMVMREAGAFAYKEGLIFEGELLHKGGKEMAFAGAFARPPRNSHEVLHPETYINGEKLPPLRIPDMKSVLNDQYGVYDSGSIGELDVRALLKQYGARKIADDLSSEWQGGSYVLYQKKGDSTAQTPVTTADLALLYISRWKSSHSAARFAKFYAGAVSQRYRTATAEQVAACTGDNCPVSTSQIATDEGPVIVEQWNDNTVMVSESFDVPTAGKLRTAMRRGAGATQAENRPQEEIGLRLLDIPAFEGLENKIADTVATEILKELCLQSQAASTPSR
ncbi:MAG TPA: hypothetical protein VMG82_39500 [Candidatus Sulfotelmatobacter sp.]|nr:hypothetical protein [Candidatus Sulfotelmatobacter sp.]